MRCYEGRVYDIQSFAAPLNHRTLRLHESLLPNRQVGAVGRGMKRNEAVYLFGVSRSSSNVTLGWSLSSSTKGKDDRRVEMTVVVLLHRTNLAPAVKTR